MATTKFYLDERKSNGDKPCVLKISIAHRNGSALLSLNTKILPSQWDNKKMRVVNHPNQMLINVYISGVKQQIDRTILSLADSGALVSMSATDIKAYIKAVMAREGRFISSKDLL